MAQPSNDRPPLTLTTNILYGVGSTAFGVHLTSLTALLLLFFNQVVGLPAAWVGMAMMVTLIFDAICDPLIGEWSDHTHSRWGRRHPFMYASAVPIAVAFYCLWNPPHGWSNQSMFVYLIVLLVTVRMLLSLYEIPSQALAPELTLDYDQRTSLMSWRFFFGAIGGAGMAILAYQVFLRKDATHPLGLMNRAGYGEFGLVAALVMMITILASCLGTHRFIANLVHVPEQRRGWRVRARELMVTVSNRSFLALIISGIIGSVSMGLSTTLDLYINNYFWEFSTTQLSYFAGMALLSSFLAVALAPAVSRRFGKKRAMIGLFVVSFFATSIPIPFRLLGLMPANHTTVLLLILLGFYLVAATLGIMGFIIVTSMMADVTEDIAVATGQRSEGLLFAANGLLQKCVTGVGTFASGLLLQFVHFPQGAIQGHVNPLILRHLVLIYVPISAGCALISIAVLLFYRIDRNVHQQNLERLNIRDAAAEVAESADAYEGVAPVSRAV